MDATEIIREIYNLPLTMKFLVIEETFKAIKNEELMQQAAIASQLSTPVTGCNEYLDSSPEAVAERRRVREENHRKYSVSFKEIGYKWDRAEANN